jgi:DNA-binding transcriptional LysR family regulator
MSQPALTVRIRHLEEALGVRLLDRTTRSVALTQIGLEFLPVVERVIGEINAVAMSARDLARRRRGMVTVAALPSIASTLLPATVAAFKARHPGILVRLRDGVAQRVSALVKSGEADFGIGSPTKRDPDLKTTVLMDDPVSAVFPPGHALERRARIALEELVTYPLILMDSQYSVRTLIDAAFESIGHTVAPPSRRATCRPRWDWSRRGSAWRSSRAPRSARPPSSWDCERCASSIRCSSGTSA